MERSNTAARRDVLGFLLGTLLIVLGDALYGLSYYEGSPTDYRWFVLSSALGWAAGLLYIRGGRGLVSWMAPGPAARWTQSAFFLFGYTLAVVHAVAGALMVVFDASIRGPEGSFSAQLTQLDVVYGTLAIPMFAALAAAFGIHGVQTVRGRGGLPRWTAIFNPLLLSALQQPFADQLWFPLRSAAWSGAVFLAVALLSRRSAKFEA